MLVVQVVQTTWSSDNGDKGSTNGGGKDGSNEGKSDSYKGVNIGGSNWKGNFGSNKESCSRSGKGDNSGSPIWSLSI
jgi:hypothetical protein